MNEETRIRHARPEELAEIMDIYAAARAFMAANGNAEQWSDGYPQKEVLQEDLKKERLYVYEEDGEIGAAFVFFIGEEPDYETSVSGAWLPSVYSGAMNSVIVCVETPDRKTEACNVCLRKMDLPSVP